MSPARTLGALRPMEAYRALSRFEGRRGHAAMRLAMHAAVPQSFRADLLHLLKLNFVPEAADDPAVEADVLLAPFSDDLGGGYFQFDPEVRRLLLDELGDTYAEEPVLRVRRVADFLLAWVDRVERRAPTSHDRLGRDFLDTQRWVALAFARPESAAEQLAEALQKAEQAATVEARLHLGGLARAVAIPLAHHCNLLDYALALHALETGDRESAADLLEPLPPEFEVGPVTLTPARVQPPRRPAVSEPIEAAQTQETIQSAPTEAADTAEPAPPSNVEEPQTPPLRVFISSSRVREMGPYRDAAAEACERLGLTPRRMDDWEAGYRAPLDRSFQELATADVYLCIVGRHYGYVPEGQNRSLIETEYDYAVQAGLPVFCFLVDEEGLPAGGHEQMEAFREKIMNSRVPAFASNVEDFATKVYATLLTWRDLRREREGLSQELPPPVEPASAKPLRKLFISSSERERPFVERLRGDLRAMGFQVGADLLGIQRAHADQSLRTADGMIYVMGQPPYSRRHPELNVLLALSGSRPLFFLLRGDADPADLPSDLARYQTVDFRTDGTYDEAFAELLRLLGGPSTGERGIGQLYGVPALPENLITLERDFAELRRLVLANDPSITVLVGPGGAGKTVMASSLAHDDEVRRRFADGIVWVTIGPSDDAGVVDARIADVLGADGPAGQFLSGRSCLLILDGADDPVAIQRVSAQMGRDGHILVTSRNSELARQLGAKLLPIVGLTPFEALRLLAQQLEMPLDQLPSEASAVADAVLRLPLGLVLAARRVRQGASWSDLLQRLRKAGPRALEKDVAAATFDDMPEGAVYIIYASEDRAAAERLAAGLEQVTDVWLDRGDLSSGKDYDLQMQRRVDRCSLVVVVLSRNAAARERGYYRREWNMVVERSRGLAAELPFIVPVIVDDLPVGAEGVPSAFWDHHAVILPQGEVTEEFLTGFVSQLRKARRPFRPGALRGDESVSGRLYGVPLVPVTFAAREGELARLRDLVLAGESRVTVLADRADFGKTVLAAALARDEDVRQHFPDGIVWASVSPDAGVDQVLATLLRALGNDVPDVSALYGRACLLILDDVEDADTVEHLAITLVGVRGHMLVTTRRTDLAFRLRARMFELGDSPFSEAVRLLAEYLEVSAERLPAEARDVADAVGPDPDGLIRAAQQVRAGADWRDLLQRLRAFGTLEWPHDEEMAGGMPDGAVLISYSSQDRHAAERLRAELGQMMDVWMDEHHLMAGDDYAPRVFHNVSRCSLFVPVLSRNAVSRPEGYFRREWDLAAERRKRISRNLPFIVPVIIDDLPVAAAGVPREFWNVQAAVLPDGVATDDFLASVRSHLRMVRFATRAVAPARRVRQTGLSRRLGERIVRDRGAHDLSRESQFVPFDFNAYQVTATAVEVVALCDADGFTENDIVRVRDRFFELVRNVPHEYGLEPRGSSLRGLLGFVFAHGCPPDMARFIRKQTRISHEAGTGGLMVSWAIDVAKGRIHTHNNPVSVFPPVIVGPGSVFPGLEYLESLLPRLSGSAAPPTSDAAEAISILYIASSRGNQPLLADEEMRTIRKSFRPSGGRTRVVVNAAWTPRTDDVIDAMLQHEPSIVHFSGLGGTSDGIVLESRAGGPHRVDEDVLEGLFGPFRESVKCVVLNACWTASQARSIVRQVPYVVGTRGDVSESVALEFAAAFYEAIAIRLDVPAAFQFAQNAVYMAGGSAEHVAMLALSDQRAR